MMAPPAARAKAKWHAKATIGMRASKSDSAANGCCCNCSSGDRSCPVRREKKARRWTVWLPLLLLLLLSLLAASPVLLGRLLASVDVGAKEPVGDWTSELLLSLLEAWAEWANPGSDPYSAPCLLSAQSGWLQMLLQADTDCGHCANLTALPELLPAQGGTGAERFRADYLDKNLPVVVRGAAADWPAVGELSIDLLRRLYRQPDGERGAGGGGGASIICQMFDYRSQFPTLGHFFRWSQHPGNLQLDSWYVGWNVCNQRVARQLRRLYQKPSFLSNDSEHGATEWIFVGGPGKGAPAHIDAVYYNTWQAQIRGSKWWRLRPPLNCYYTCRHVYEVLLRPGDIIALKTSKWIHETEVEPGDISIALGAEFD